MLPEIEQLLRLQHCDQRLKALQAELETVPIERKRIERTVAAQEGAFEQVKQQSRDFEMQRKKLELEVKARQDSIGRYKTQQFQTRKNEEFQALGHEIQRLEREVRQIEDKELELMEESERAQKQIQQAEQELRAAKTHFGQQLEALEQKEQVLAGQVREAASEREKLVAGIDPDLLFQYDRLFASKGGDAVVAVEHEVCTGCHMKNTTTTVYRAKLGREIIHCEQCGRILYFAN
jgi:predicted  nucleic acid-binding Zn-ribbon protein